MRKEVEAAAGQKTGAAASLSPERRERFSRQMRFQPIGETGQVKLAAASVLVVGIGALGASLAQHMVRAGVGNVRIADRDYVELSNLQRQVLFDEEDARAALPKAVAAACKLRRIDSSIRIEPHVVDVREETIGPLLEGIDIVLDGTDNAAARLLLNERCYRLGIPLIYGGASGSGGMSAVFIPGESACLRCVIGDEAGGDDGATCDSGGILAPAVELIASLQAVEALKWLTGNRDVMRTGWLAVDLWPFRIRELQMPSVGPACPVCGTAAAERQGDHTHAAEESAAVVLCGRDTVQVTLGRPLDLHAASVNLGSRGCAVIANPYLLRAELPEGRRMVLFSDGRVLVQGTADPDEATAICRFYLESGEGVTTVVR
jgi:adenylyltransferase/sulfurtransferase